MRRSTVILLLTSAFFAGSLASPTLLQFLHSFRTDQGLTLRSQNGHLYVYERMDRGVAPNLAVYWMLSGEMGLNKEGRCSFKPQDLQVYTLSETTAERMYRKAKLSSEDILTLLLSRVGGKITLGGPPKGP